MRYKKWLSPDPIAYLLCLLCALLLLFLAFFIGFQLYQASIPSIKTFGWHFLWSAQWNPATKAFGALVPVFGTILTATLALLLGVPVSLGIAFFLTELSPAYLKRPLRVFIELLAGIPSIIYGMWGLFILAPILANYLQPWLIRYLGAVPVIGQLFQGPPLGIGILSAGIVLSIMIVPFVASVMCDMFEIVPGILKESAYALGATKFEVLWHIILPYSRKGVMGGIVLGLCRALGETMAVAFVIGNAHQLTRSLLMPGVSIASVLANEFTEATGPLYRAALHELGLVLFGISVFIFVCAKLWMRRCYKPG